MPKPLPDIVGPDLKILFCGLNPGLVAAATGRHFAGRGNRFWEVLHLSGLTPTRLTPEQDREILRYRLGLTCVVDRPTAGAQAVAREEFARAGQAFLGKAAYGAIRGERSLAWGPQQETFSGAATWVLPNPSGRNRAFSLDDLVEAYACLRGAAPGHDPR
jgi:TDG/mug DNA glycosylase family protein